MTKIIRATVRPLPSALDRRQRKKVNCSPTCTTSGAFSLPKIRIRQNNGTNQNRYKSWNKTSCLPCVWIYLGATLARPSIRAAASRPHVRRQSRTERCSYTPPTHHRNRPHAVLHVYVCVNAPLPTALPPALPPALACFSAALAHCKYDQCTASRSNQFER